MPLIPGQNDLVQEDADEEARTARWAWTLLRDTVEKLAMPGEEQIKDPEMDECFDWDPGYLMVDRCQSAGWVSPDLLVSLDSVDTLLDRLSRDPRCWSDASVVGDPLWDQVRSTSKKAVALMPIAPWNDDGDRYDNPVPKLTVRVRFPSSAPTTNGQVRS